MKMERWTTVEIVCAFILLPIPFSSFKVRLSADVTSSGSNMEYLGLKGV